MNKLEDLRRLLLEIPALEKKTPYGAEYELWKAGVENCIRSQFGDEALKLFKRQASVVIPDTDEEFLQDYLRELENKGTIIKGLIKNPRLYASSKKIGQDQKPTPDQTSLLNPEMPPLLRYLDWGRRVLFAKPVMSILLLLILLLVALYLRPFLFPPQHFTFTPQGQAFVQKSLQASTTIQFVFDVDVKNISSESRYLKDFIHVVWTDRDLGSVLEYTYSTSFGEVYEVVGNKTTPVNLPLEFKANETRRLEWRSERDFSGDTELLETLGHKICEGPFCWSDAKLELLIADSRGNLYDQKGKLFSQEVIDQWWVYPQQGNWYENLNELVSLIFNIVSWKVQDFFQLYS